jgi:hypothetical protein
MFTLTIIVLITAFIIFAIWVFLFEKNLKKNMDSNKPEFKAYLDKTFLEELSYKLWVTKGSRFIANKRLMRQSNLSNISIALLSSYLIIASLLAVYQLSFSNLIDANLLAFGSTTLSILVLVFSQIENAGDYKIKAMRFHDCALEFGTLYNEVRKFKTLEYNDTIAKEQVLKFCNEIDHKYQGILRLHENHDPVDYTRFQLENNEYFKFGSIKFLRGNAYIFFKTTLLYYSLIILPPVIVVLFLILKS